MSTLFGQIDSVVGAHLAFRIGTAVVPVDRDNEGRLRVPVEFGTSVDGNYLSPISHQKMSDGDLNMLYGFGAKYQGHNLAVALLPRLQAFISLERGAPDVFIRKPDIWDTTRPEQPIAALRTPSYTTIVIVRREDSHRVNLASFKPYPGLIPVPYHRLENGGEYEWTIEPISYFPAAIQSQNAYL